MASMTATNTLEDSQSVATRPNETSPVGGPSWSRWISLTTTDAASPGSMATISSAGPAGRDVPLAASRIAGGRRWAVSVITSARNGTSAAMA